MRRQTAINLYIAGNHFPLTVTEKEEEILRKAAQLLNEEVEKRQGELLSKNYSKEKIIAAAALTTIAGLVEQTTKVNSTLIEEKLEEIRMLLEDSII